MDLQGNGCEPLLVRNNFCKRWFYRQKVGEVIQHLSKEDKNVRGIKFRRNYGKSPALFCGFKAAQGNVVITMDADLQDSPDEIPALYKMITEDGYDLVSGYKQKRYDPLTKTIPTKLFNATARKISGVKKSTRL